MKAQEKLSNTKKFLVVVLTLFLNSCQEREVHYKFTETEKSALLYYAYNVGSTFYVFNSIDTFMYVVSNKQLYEEYAGRQLNEDKYYEVYNMTIECLSNNSVTVSASKEGSSTPPSFSLKFNNQLGTNQLDLNSFSDTINGVYYADLYRLYSLSNSNEYIITSRSQGIVYAQNDTLTYERIY